jgi:hypothetical protein
VSTCTTFFSWESRKIAHLTIYYEGIDIFVIFYKYLRMKQAIKQSRYNNI